MLVDTLVDTNPREAFQNPIHRLFKTDEKANENTRPLITDITKNKPKVHQEYFPTNPHDFKPLGLTKVEHEGSKNGQVICWMSGKTTVFRWDQDLNNSPHYHILTFGYGDMDLHFFPGDAVPEPLNSIYFGLDG